MASFPKITGSVHAFYFFICTCVYVYQYIETDLHADKENF